MNDDDADPLKSYGGTRTGPPDAVSFAQVERAARELMKLGERPTVRSVIKAMGKGSPNVVADCLRRFWKDTAAMGSGDAIALLRLPPELAEAAVAQWAQALRLAQQSARHDQSAARARLEELQREADLRVQSIELREKEWDMAARIRDTALADARAQVSHLLKEQSRDRADIREKEAKIEALEAEILDLREFVMVVVKKPAAGKRRRGTNRTNARPKRSQSKLAKKPSGGRPRSKKRTRSA